LAFDNWRSDTPSPLAGAWAVVLWVRVPDGLVTHGCCWRVCLWKGTGGTAWSLLPCRTMHAGLCIPVKAKAHASAARERQSLVTSANKRRNFCTASMQKCWQNRIRHFSHRGAGTVGHRPDQHTRKLKPVT
jgi:hypothetical protein